MKKQLFIAVMATLSMASLSTPVQAACGDKINNFTINGSLVTDKTTGLMWSKCNINKDKNDCSGGATQLTWDQIENQLTQKNNSKFLGHNDWRLPNIKELVTIIDYGCVSAKPKTYAWSRTEKIKHMWSSTPKPMNGSNKQYAFVDGDKGTTWWNNINAANRYVHLVRDAN